MTRPIDTDLTLRRSGDPDGPPMVFLHGLTDSGAGWPGAEQHWGPTYSVLALDQRGHGTSPRFTDEQLRAHPGEVMVDDAIRVLEQLDAPVVLLGHSLGGAVALAAGVRRPELVRGLVLEDPAPLGPDDPQQDRARGAEFLDGLRDSREARDDDALLAVRRAAHPDWPENELLVTGRAEKQVDVRYLAHGDLKPTTRWPELFARVRVPTLLVTGDRLDEVVVTEELERGILDLGNPAVEVVRLAGAAHCVRREAPEGYYATVDAFLSHLP